MWTQLKIQNELVDLLLDFIDVERTKKYLRIGGINELLIIWLDDLDPIFQDLEDKEEVKNLNKFTGFLQKHKDSLFEQNDNQLLESDIWKEVQAYARKTLDLIMSH